MNNTKCANAIYRTIGNRTYIEPWYIPELWSIWQAKSDEEWYAPAMSSAAFWKLQGDILGSMVQ